jgi:hypothetical protein
VGALADGADAALAAGVSTIIVLAGRNVEAAVALRRRYLWDRRIRVLDFTEQMTDLLQAADAIVHGTGGVTSLEALTCGCPLVGFGTRLAHVREHYGALAGLGLCRISTDVAELRGELAGLIAGAWPVADPMQSAALDGARAVLQASRRVRPMTQRRQRTQRVSLVMAMTATMFWGVATDDAFSLAARPLHLSVPAGLVVRGRAVGVVVVAPPARLAGLARALAIHTVHVSFGVTGPLDHTSIEALRRAGDDAVPILPGAGAVRWLATGDQLDDVQGFAADRLAIAPGGMTSLGQYLLARSTGHRLIAAMPNVAQGTPRPGEILLVRADELGTVRRLVSSEARLGFAAVPVSQLLSGASAITAPTDRDRPSRSVAPPITPTSPEAPTLIPTGPCASAPVPIRGPRTTGMTTCTANSSGATRVAASRWNAVISAINPRIPAPAHAAAHNAAAGHRPSWKASVTSWVANPLQAKHSPATSAATRGPADRRRASSQAMNTAAPSNPQTSAVALDGGVVKRAAGATAARVATPATIAPTAPTSRLVTDSLSLRAPATSSATSPNANAGWTTESGANSNAAAWTGQPSNPSAVPSSHRRRRSRTAISRGRHPSSDRVVRASSACRTTPAL